MIGLVAITARQADFQAAYGQLASAMQDTVRDAERDFAKTTRTWRRKPKFDKRVSQTPQRIEGEVSTDSDIYRYVSGGTRVRYATMTPGFTAKTVPRWIGSRPGSGGLLFVSKKRPRPGIKGREFDKEIAKKLHPYFVRRFQLAMSQAARSSGHAVK